MRPSKGNTSAVAEKARVLSIDLVGAQGSKQVGYTADSSPQGEAIVQLMDEVFAALKVEELVFTHESGLKLKLSIRGGGSILSAAALLGL